jgi:hypothetical protein
MTPFQIVLALIAANIVGAAVIFALIKLIGCAL